jgi:hypothetical protein
MARKTRQVETRMVSEYLLKNYFKFPYIIKVPLGALPDDGLKREGFALTARTLRPFRPEVDAVVLLPRHLLIIEAKVWNIVNGLAKLPMYKSLVDITPELQQYMPREVIMQIVVGWTNPNLERMAQVHNIQVRVFCPDWLKEVVEDLHKYWTSEYQAAREDKLQMQRYFGVE